jgi:hypothetical protein
MVRFPSESVTPRRNDSIGIKLNSREYLYGHNERLVEVVVCLLIVIIPVLGGTSILTSMEIAKQKQHVLVFKLIN